MAATRYWEAEHGEPFKSPAGHGYKLRDYCKVIKEGLATVAGKKGRVTDPGWPKDGTLAIP